MGNSGSSVPSEKSVKRLCVYRRIIRRMIARGETLVRSNDLASKAGVSAAQVRRDIMSIGYQGSPNIGYQSGELYKSIGRFLGVVDQQKAALVGVGNLGRSILGYFDKRNLSIVLEACFDVNEDIQNRFIHNCYCYPLEKLGDVVKEKNILIGIVAVPFVDAPGVADALVEAGVKGILNFSPTNLVVPEDVYVEDMDITASLETVAFYTFPKNKRRI